MHECACECAHKAAQIKLSTIVAATKADRGAGGRRETKESVELPARTRDGGSAATATAAEQQSSRAGAAVASALPTAALAQEILSALPKHLSQVRAKNRQSKIAAEGGQSKREKDREKRRREEGGQADKAQKAAK